jgi:hypothetical protein
MKMIFTAAPSFTMPGGTAQSTMTDPSAGAMSFHPKVVGMTRDGYSSSSSSSSRRGDFPFSSGKEGLTGSTLPRRGGVLVLSFSGWPLVGPGQSSVGLVIKIVPKQLLKLGATEIMDRGGVSLVTKSDHILDWRQLVK